jgi:hypothetical protein
MRTTRNRKRNGVALALLAAVATGAVAIPSAFSAHRSGAGEAILIKTHITFRAAGPVGEVLRGSFSGDSAFCPGGRFRDRSRGETVIKRFRCGNGRLKISFRPQGEPTSSGPWKVVGGTGRFEGLRGHGWMAVKGRDGRPPEGRETFTGTVTG